MSHEIAPSAERQRWGRGRLTTVPRPRRRTRRRRGVRPHRPHQAAEARVTLLARLGSHFLALQEAGRAVAILDEAFRLDPDRRGLAEELAKALEAAGHRARAAEVRQRYVQRE